MKLLLISNSTMAGETYLEWPYQHITDFLHRHQVKSVCFIPYAGISLGNGDLIDSFNAYTKRVTDIFQTMGVAVRSMHQSNHPVQMIRESEAIVTGGGNTFHLVYSLEKEGIMSVIREKVLAGMPYIGWSAGSNIASPTLMTTNDMPIIKPESFKTLGLIPFQINPHYLDAHPSGHGGETREQRINEYLIVNRHTTVAGLREGCLLWLENGKLQLVGDKSLRIFHYGMEPQELAPGNDLSFLLK